MAVNKVLLVGLTKIRQYPKALFRDHNPDRVMCLVPDNKDSLSELLFSEQSNHFHERLRAALRLMGLLKTRLKEKRYERTDGNNRGRYSRHLTLSRYISLGIK